MSIIHVVLFQWKTTTPKEKIDEVCNALLALEKTCIHPASNKPYIKWIKVGGNNSPEGLADPYTHGFVMEFENAEDRDYYVDKDLAHQDFKKLGGEFLESAKVFDFEPGKF